MAEQTQKTASVSFSQDGTCDEDRMKNNTHPVKNNCLRS